MSKCLKCGEFVNASKTGVRFLTESRGPFHPGCAREVEQGEKLAAKLLVERRRADVARSTRGASPVASDTSPGEDDQGPS